MVDIKRMTTEVDPRPPLLALALLWTLVLPREPLHPRYPHLHSRFSSLSSITSLQTASEYVVGFRILGRVRHRFQETDL